MIGGINVDIGARPLDPLVFKDSNPGIIQTSLGGVGRNIAHNLSLLGEKPVMLGALGDDIFADQVLEKCEQAGIDMSHVLRKEGAPTSTYVYICDNEGEMQLAASDMRVTDFVSAEYLMAERKLLEESELIVLDTNIPKESIALVLEIANCPVLVDPVSVAKSKKLSSCLDRIHTLKPNRMEAEALSGIAISDADSCRAAAEKLLEKGLQRVFISLGSDGVMAADRDMTMLIPCQKAVMVNATGAGDAFMAACAVATLQGKDLETTAKMGQAAAAIAIESPMTINPVLSLGAVEKRIAERN